MFCGYCGKDIGDQKVCPYCHASSNAPSAPAAPLVQEDRTVLYGEPPVPAPDVRREPPVYPSFQEHPRYPDRLNRSYELPYPPQSAVDISQGYPQPQFQPQPEKKKSRRGLVAAIIIIVVLLIAGGGVAVWLLTATTRDYEKAMELKNSGSYQAAIEKFSALGNYEDSAEQVVECKYLDAKRLVDAKKYNEAKEALNVLGDYKDSRELIARCDYEKGIQLFNAQKYSEAKSVFESLDGYSDSEQRLIACKYYIAKEQIEDEPEKAIATFKELENYEDSGELLKDAMFAYCKKHPNAGDDTVYDYMKTLKNAGYDGADELYKQIYAYKLINVFWNTSKSDNNSLTAKKEIKEKDPKVLHFTVTGGAPDDKMLVYYTVTWPNGEKTDSRYTEAGSAYTLTLTSCPKGTLTVDIYTDQYEKLGTTSVKVI